MGGLRRPSSLLSLSLQKRERLGAGAHARFHPRKGWALVSPEIWYISDKFILNIRFESSSNTQCNSGGLDSGGETWKRDANSR